MTTETLVDTLVEAIATAQPVTAIDRMVDALAADLLADPAADVAAMHDDESEAYTFACGLARELLARWPMAHDNAAQR